MITFLLAAALSASPPAVSGPAAIAALPACPTAALSLGTDREGDGFAGMSHQGTLLVVRNIGPKACHIPSLPTVSMQDAHGADLPARRQPPAGMHPGPVMSPVGLAPGAEATSAILWVSGAVYDHSRCVTPARISVAIGGGASLMAPWPGSQMCGEAGRPATFRQPPLRIDPRIGDPGQG